MKHEFAGPRWDEEHGRWRAECERCDWYAEEKTEYGAKIAGLAHVEAKRLEEQIAADLGGMLARDPTRAVEEWVAFCQEKVRELNEAPWDMRLAFLSRLYDADPSVVAATISNVEFEFREAEENGEQVHALVCHCTYTRPIEHIFVTATIDPKSDGEAV